MSPNHFIVALLLTVCLGIARGEKLRLSKTFHNSKRLRKNQEGGQSHRCIGRIMLLWALDLEEVSRASSE